MTIGHGGLVRQSRAQSCSGIFVARDGLWLIAMGKRLEFFALQLFIALALLLEATTTSSTQTEVHSPQLTGDNDKVLVELYSESLCPYCAKFIVNHLSKFFTNGLIDIADLSLIPYGNAKMDSKGTLVCQHGPDECKLNIVQACVIRLWPNVTEWFPFIYCLESLPRTLAAQTWTSCGSSGLNTSSIEECYEGPLGYQLEKEFAEITNKLEPPHTYVPWVVVNGLPLYEDYENVEKYVCDAYKGPKQLPEICKEVDDQASLQLVGDLKDKACYLA